jgi:putative ABC transport system permease protein
MGNYVDFRAQSKAFDQMGAVEARQFQLTGDADAEQVQGGLATSSLFAVLGVKPSLGRVFVEGEDYAGCAKVVVLSHSLWRGRYGADPQIIGKTVLINGEKYAVLGVMPEAFRFPNGDTELWTPVGTVYQSSEWSRRDRNNLMVVAHLKAGVSLTQADQEIQAIAGRLKREFPATNPAYVEPLREYFIGDVRPLFRILFGAVVFVLLICCANVANLFLSRSTRVRRQIAIARAIGASNFQIVKQMLIESCLLSVIGGIIGLLFASWSLGFLGHLIPTDISRITELNLDYRVLLFTFTIAILSGILFGSAPAAQLLRGDLANTLKESSTKMGVGPTTRRFQAILVCTEVALCFVLLIGAGLLIQTFARLRAVDLGFTTKDVLTARIRLSPKYSSPTRRIAFYDELIRQAKALPGVVSVGLTTGVPLVVKGATTGIWVERQDGVPLSAGSVNNRSVTPDYFQTIGTSVLRGRSVLESDGPNSLPVALVNETLARESWPGVDPIGKKLKIGRSPSSNNPWMTVVGLVRDIKQAGLDVPSKPEMYLPLQQQPEQAIAVAIRTRQNFATLASGVRAIMRNLDSDLPLIDVATMDDVLDKEVFVID